MIGENPRFGNGRCCHSIGVDRASRVQHGSHQRCGGGDYPITGNGNRELLDLIGSSGSARATAGTGYLHTMQGELLDRSRGAAGNGD